ncbi:MAG: hypothetical protein GY699_16560 [Desulfobacteraceae bacterium]|nr:hypothetical protein [Desulfobacteraceae bacterium]
MNDDTPKKNNKDNRKPNSDRRESSGKMKEEFIDFFIPENEEKRNGKDRRQEDKK